MKIAVTHENGQIFGHFGHTAEFKVYEVKDGKILSSEVIQTGENGHGALAELLARIGAELVICGGIGTGAVMALAAEGIALCAGVSGDCDAALEAYLTGKLSCTVTASCDHHHSHGEGHDCHHHHGHDCHCHG